MQPLNDVERIRRDVSLVDKVADLGGVDLARDGEEHIGLCPFHGEDTPSFTVCTGKDHVERFHCFGCGAHGDVLDFVQAIQGVDLPAAIRIIDGGKAGANVAPRRVERPDIYQGIVPLRPVRGIPAGERVRIYNPKRADDGRAWGAFVPSLIHPYRYADGTPLGYVLRRDMPDGKKETPMVMWVRLPSGEECWCRYPFPKPRPLYGVETIEGQRQVIIVEGEKCRDKLALASGRAVVSWPGGTYGARYVDWSPLAGRNCLLWPDADRVGLSTMDEIGEQLSAFEGTTVRRIRIEAGAP